MKKLNLKKLREKQILTKWFKYQGNLNFIYCIIFICQHNYSYEHLKKRKIKI